MKLYEKKRGGASEMLRSKKCSAAEICDDVLERIHETEDKIGAYVTLCEKTAKENAAAVDKALASGESLHPLAGIPIGIKDNISTKGIRLHVHQKCLKTIYRRLTLLLWTK